MTSDNNSVSVPNKIALSTKPELQPPLTEEGDEWEGFYEDDEYEEF